MRITTKFIGSSALIITLTTLLSGNNYLSYHKGNEVLNTSYAQAEASVASVMQLELSLKNQILALNRLAVIAESDEELERYERASQSFFQALDQLEASIPESDTISHIRFTRLRSQQQYLENIAEQLSAQISSDVSAKDSSTKDIDTEAVTRSLRIFESQTQIGFYSQSLLESLQEQATSYEHLKQSSQRQTEFLGMFTPTIILLLLIAQYYGILKPVVRSLTQLQAGVDALGRSPSLETAKETAKINLNTQDELQSVADAFNQMSERLMESHRELEARVAQRTVSLQVVNQSLEQEVTERIETENDLNQAMAQLKQTQLQLLQSEKMSGLSQLVAGVAHEINNPASFIQGNLEPAQDYVENLLSLLHRYQAEYPEASSELQSAVAQADLDFIQEDFPLLIQSVQTGVDRITEIVRSLQIFSHHDESETKAVDIHQGIDSALLILSAQLNATGQRPAITVKKQYGDLPKVYCYASQLNQVFMGLLTNAIEALDHSARPTITITTAAKSNDTVSVSITDSGTGMSAAVQRQIFDPFFTTKAVGDGNGLGLAMSYQIVTVNHQGTFTCYSQPGRGTTFTVEVPLSLKIVKPLAVTTIAA